MPCPSRLRRRARINFHGRYPIVRSHQEAALRPLRDPTTDNDQSWP